MQLQAVLKGVEIRKFSGNMEGDVSAICYNSKKCEKNSLFVAVRGLKFDGHHYITEAVDLGAKFIIHEKDWAPPPGILAIMVPDTRRALGVLGKNFYNDPSAHLCLIGVTGTNGKTTVTYLLESILCAAGYHVGVLGTVNYRFHGKVLPAPNTTPESYELQRILREMVDQKVTHVVMEVSSHAIDLRRIDDCSFDMGIFTNLSQDHLDYHETLENYFQAKKRFFDEILPSGEKSQRSVVINTDDPWGQRLLKEAVTSIPLRTYGLECVSGTTVSQYALSLEGIRADVTIGKKSVAISSCLIGKFNLSNILAAIAASHSLNIPAECIQAGIENVKYVPGRLEKIIMPGKPDVFVDYAHTEDALLRVLQNLSAFKKEKIITVFGCGGDRDRGKRPLMGKAATTWSDLTILTSDNPRTEDPLSIISQIEAGVCKNSVKKFLPEEINNNMKGKGYMIIPDRKKAIETAVTLAGTADIVLIAGKGHENYQIIGSKSLPFDDRHIAKEALINKQ